MKRRTVLLLALVGALVLAGGFLLSRTELFGYHACAHPSLAVAKSESNVPVPVLSNETFARLPASFRALIEEASRVGEAGAILSDGDREATLSVLRSEGLDQVFDWRGQVYVLNQPIC